jgi:hypothetical protein
VTASGVTSKAPASQTTTMSRGGVASWLFFAQVTLSVPGKVPVSWVAVPSGPILTTQSSYAA